MIYGFEDNSFLIEIKIENLFLIFIADKTIGN
jgi:hypothetical protein